MPHRFKLAIATLLACATVGGLAAAPASASYWTDKAVALYLTQQDCRRYTGCDTARAYVEYGFGYIGCSSWYGHFPTRYYGWRTILYNGIGGCR